MTISAMKKINQANGLHFFDKETFEYWNNKIEQEPDDFNVFVMSQQPESDKPKLYKVYIFDKHSGIAYNITPENIETAISNYQSAFTDIELAKAYANKFSQILEGTLDSYEGMIFTVKNGEQALTAESKDTETIAYEFSKVLRSTLTEFIVNNDMKKCLDYIVSKSIYGFKVHSDLGYRNFEQDFPVDEDTLQTALVKFLDSEQPKDNFNDFLWDNGYCDDMLQYVVGKYDEEFDEYLTEKLKEFGKELGLEGDIYLAFINSEYFAGVTDENRIISDKTKMEHLGYLPYFPERPAFKDSYHISLPVTTAHERNLDLNAIYDMLEIGTSAETIADPDNAETFDNGVTWLLAQQGHSLSELADDEAVKNNAFLTSVKDELESVSAYYRLCLVVNSEIKGANIIGFANALKEGSDNKCICFDERATVGICEIENGTNCGYNILLEKALEIPANMVAYSDNYYTRLQIKDATHSKELYPMSEMISSSQYGGEITVESNTTPKLFKEGQITIFNTSSKSEAGKFNGMEVKVLGQTINGDYDCKFLETGDVMTCGTDELNLCYDRNYGEKPVKEKNITPNIEK